MKVYGLVDEPRIPWFLAKMSVAIFTQSGECQKLNSRTIKKVFDYRICIALIVVGFSVVHLDDGHM